MSGNGCSDSLSLLDNPEKTITTKELAEVLGVGVQTVRNAVEKLAQVLGRVSVNSQGGYLFTEEQATRIKMEIQSHHNLATRQIDSVATDFEMELMTQKVIEYHIQKSNALQAQIENMTPAYQFGNRILSVTEKTLCFREAAKAANLDFGGNTLIRYLKHDGYLMDDSEPYQRFIDQGLFVITEVPYTTQYGDKINIQTRVTQKGLKMIMEKYGRDSNNTKDS